MSTARVRNYVKNNPDTVEVWRRKLIHTYLVNMLTHDHHDTEQSLMVNIHKIVRNANQHKICKDVLEEHYGIAHVHASSSAWGRVYAADVVDKSFQEYIKGKGVKPELFVYDRDNTKEDDIYTSLSDLSIASLVWIYEHQDDYEFKYTANRKSSMYQVCVLDKDIVDEADNLSFRNAIDKYYITKTGEVAKAVLGINVPLLNRHKSEYGKKGTIYTYNLTGVHKEMRPEGYNQLNSEKVSEYLKKAEAQVEFLSQTMEQLRQLQASILEAEAAGDFEDVFYRRLIDHFVKNAPLLINDNRSGVKELAIRATKKHYH